MLKVSIFISNFVKKVMDLIIFILICYGASNIMVFGSNFNGWREFWEKLSPKIFGKLFSCMICLPFWWGVILSETMYSPSFFMNGDMLLTLFGYEIPSNHLSTFFDGCLASGSIWLIHTIQEFFERGFKPTED